MTSHNSVEKYHLEELRIACRRWDPRCVLPEISPQHKRILDVGCGAGQTLIGCGVDGRRSWGVDVSIDALQLGKKLSQETNFVMAAGEALPFSDNSFDLIISRVALPYMRIALTLREMARVLRPGGSLWLTLHRLTYTKAQLLRAATEADLRALGFQMYVLANGFCLHLFSRQIRFPFTTRCESFQTGSGMRRVLRKSGFEQIRIYQQQHFVVTAQKPLSRESSKSSTENDHPRLKASA